MIGVGRAAFPHAENLYASRCVSLGTDHGLTKDAFRLWQSLEQGNQNDEALQPSLDRVPLKTKLAQSAMLMMSLVSFASELDLQLTPEHRQQTFR